MEKFDVVGRSRGARNLPINIFIYLIFARHQRRRSRTTISIFGGIGTKEAISASTAGAKPAATGRVGEAEKAKYDPARYNPALSPPSYLDMRSSIYIDRCIHRDGGWESKSRMA